MHTRLRIDLLREKEARRSQASKVYGVYNLAAACRVRVKFLYLGPVTGKCLGLFARFGRVYCCIERFPLLPLCCRLVTCAARAASGAVTARVSHPRNIGSSEWVTVRYV